MTELEVAWPFSEDYKLQLRTFAGSESYIAFLLASKLPGSPEIAAT